MNLSREEFENHLNEGQNLLLHILSQNPDISPDKFYKVANFMETLSLYSGVIYSLIENGKDNKIN